MIIAGTIFGSVLGAYGVHKWGTLTMETECLKGENNKYEGEIELLQNNIDGLRINQIQIHNYSVHLLHQQKNKIKMSTTHCNYHNHHIVYSRSK